MAVAVWNESKAKDGANTKSSVHRKVFADLVSICIGLSLKQTS